MADSTYDRCKDAPALYVARFTVGQKVLAVCLVVSYSALAGFFWRAGGRYRLTFFFLLLGLGWTLYYAARVFGSWIRFTELGVAARYGWFRTVAIEYDQIAVLRGRWYTGIEYKTADGRRLPIYDGLGDRDVIQALLDRKCPPTVILDLD